MKGISIITGGAPVLSMVSLRNEISSRIKNTALKFRGTSET